MNMKGTFSNHSMAYAIASKYKSTLELHIRKTFYTKFS